MRRVAPGFVLAAVLAGCSTRDSGTPAAQQSPAAPESSATEFVIQRSPVPAFHGGGADWRIDLKADGGLRHTAHLLRSGRWANATLELRSATPAAAPSAFMFEGTLFAIQGDTPLRLEITRADCKDVDGAVRMQTVAVSVQGAKALQGCGEITPY